MPLALAWRLVRREMRGGLRGFGVFLACLALGVAVVAAVGSLAAAVNAGLDQDARALLGGDLALELFHRPASAAERNFLASQGALSQVAEMRAMARTPDGQRTSLIELKAVDGAYPLHGAVTLAGADGAAAPSLADALAQRDGQWGAAVASGLLDRLGVALGDKIRVGDAVLVVRAVLTHEPDAFSGFELGPRVMIAAPALAATGLVTPGTLVQYAYRLRLPPGREIGATTAAIRSAFPDAGWRIRNFANAAPNLQRLLDRLTVFLTLVGLMALIVGGVGVGNAVASYLAGKTETIATFKCLGAPARLIFAVYLAEILTIAAGGILFGLILGALAPFAAASLLPAQLPVAARLGLYPAPLLIAAGFGVLTTLAFALWPLGAASKVSAASLFRAGVAPALGRAPRGAMLAVGVAGALLAALAVLSAPDRRTALWSVLGAAAALLVFRLAAAVLLFALRRSGRPRHPGLRLALADLQRPGAPTAGVLASLGLGLAVLVAIILVEGNLAREIDTNLPAHAPSFFFIDIQLLHRHPARSGGGVRRASPWRAGGDGRSAGADPSRAHHRGKRHTGRARQDRRRRALGDQQRSRPYLRRRPPRRLAPRRRRLVAGGLPRTAAGLVRFGPRPRHGAQNRRHADGECAGPRTHRADRQPARDRLDFPRPQLRHRVFAGDARGRAADRYRDGARRAGRRGGARRRRRAALSQCLGDLGQGCAGDAVRDHRCHRRRSVSIVSAVALAAGALVLAGAIAAGHRRRVYEAVVLKVLGATRADVARAFLIEYGILGLAAAGLAAIIGTLAIWLVLTRVMDADWRFLPGAVLATVVLATLFTLLGGFAGTWRALGAKAAAFLRND